MLFEPHEDPLVSEDGTGTTVHSIDDAGRKSEESDVDESSRYKAITVRGEGAPLHTKWTTLTTNEKPLNTITNIRVTKNNPPGGGANALGSAIGGDSTD